MRRVDTVPFLSEFMVRAAPLVNAFRDWALAHDFLRNDFYPQADHFCYRCGEGSEYDEVRRRFEEHAGVWKGSRFIHQTVRSGRRMAVIGLVQPILTPFGDLRVLELTEPNPIGEETAGFEHVEIFTSVGSFEDMAAALNGKADTGVLEGRFNLPKFNPKKGADRTTWDARITADPPRHDRQDFNLKITSGPLIERLAVRMR